MLLDVLLSVRVKYIPIIVLVLIVLIYKFHPRHEVVHHTKCPHSWIKFQDHCYKLVKRVTTFTEAVEMCKKENANLPIVLDKETNDFLINYPLPSPLYMSKKMIDKVHDSHIDDSHDHTKYRSVYEHAHHVKAIWLNVEPVYLFNFTGKFYWTPEISKLPSYGLKEMVSFSNFSKSDPAKDLFDIGLPYVTGLTINGDMLFHLEMIKKGLSKPQSKEEERMTMEAINDHLKEVGMWQLYIDLNVCGHCYAAICQKTVSISDGGGKSA